MENVASLSPQQARQLIRAGKLCRPTSGVSQGYAQANLAILPKDLAYDFLLFAQRNPKPCPILDVTEVGSPEPRLVGSGADLRYDIAKYRVYRKGAFVEEVNNLEAYWTKDMVGFLLGCSFSFETALLKNDVPVRHIEEGCNVPMFITNIPCTPAGVFSGPMVVSMRPIPEKMVVRAVQVTSRFPAVHGAPVHVGAYSRSEQTGFWRCCYRSSRRGAGFLGLRRNAASGGDEYQAGADDYACSGVYVYLRYDR